MSRPVIEAIDIQKTFQQGKLDVEVLKGIDFSVGTGETHAIIGASGAGKSTLMHLLGGLDHTSAGEVKVMGQSISKLSEKKLGVLRNHHLGFIYQFHHLLGEFTAMENVAMPLLIRGESTRSARDKAIDLLNRVGLSERLTHKPAELSGGERQRAAVARALVGKPRVVLGDEPTGNLDPANTDRVLDILFDYANREVATLVTVTHDHDLIDRFSTVIDFKQFHASGTAEQPAEAVPPT